MNMKGRREIFVLLLAKPNIAGDRLLFANRGPQPDLEPGGISGSIDIGGVNPLILIETGEKVAIVRGNPPEKIEIGHPGAVLVAQGGGLHNRPPQTRQITLGPGMSIGGKIRLRATHFRG